jgi:hypothetical protein
MFQAARFAPSKASGIAKAPWTISVVGFLFEFPKFCVQTLQEFLGFVPPAPGARLNFGKDLLRATVPSSKLAVNLRRPRCGPSDQK